MEPAPNMITYNTVINGLWSVSTYNCIIANLCWSHEIEKAMDVFLYMRKKKCKADEEPGGRCPERQGCVLEEARTVSRTVILKAYVQNGDVNMVSHQMPRRDIVKGLECVHD
ncbi:hypothetical protein SELMODRAFT_418649 [Selaginella moellendorffii]|uniref:Pentatricopeptide repeat-containing protein n=1 Tax=Selaginella moellendorffii TaxID=88036 RepID=D8S6Q1_SELML|nr:hypothetical protein SELMODRAFT_418649 [Selaginella moellendorffii]